MLYLSHGLPDVHVRPLSGRNNKARSYMPSVTRGASFYDFCIWRKTARSHCNSPQHTSGLLCLVYHPCRHHRGVTEIAGVDKSARRTGVSDHEQ